MFKICGRSIQRVIKVNVFHYMNNTHCIVEHCAVLIPVGHNNQTINQDLLFVWPCIIDTNNIDSQPDATITAY